MAGEIRTRESALWKWMKTGLGRLNYLHHVHRVENEVEAGDPDVEGCIDGVSFHVELKVAERFRADGSFEVRIEGNQAYWAHSRVRAGGLSFVLVRVETEHYLVPGHRALDLFDARKKLTRQDLANWSVCHPKATSQTIWMTIIGRFS